MTEPIRRPAARVLLVDEGERVLLFRGRDPRRPAEPYWFTPGGGLRPGESAAQGAVRELTEETGLRVAPAELGAPVWHEVVHFSFAGAAYRQEQQFFLLRVPGWRVDTAGFDPVERETIDAHRWWTAEELDRTAESFYPADLPAVLRRALRGEFAC